MNRTLPLMLLVAALSQSSAATVEAVKGRASARATAPLPPGSRFATQKASQSQIRLDRGFVRLGSSSEVEVGAEDEVKLQQGVMMVGSEAAKKRGRIKVTAPGYSFQVQGTALIAYSPGNYIKITVLEGRIRVALQSLLGEFETLEAGQMLVINPADQRLPDPVEVDLNRLVSTSQLTSGSLGPAPTDPFIQSSALEQSGDSAAGEVARTPFALRGASPEVTVFQLVNDLDDAQALVSERSYSPTSADEFTTLANKELTTSGAKTRTLNVDMRAGGDNFDVLPSLAGTISVDPSVFGGAPQKLTFRSTDPLQVLPGANVSTPENTALELRARALDIQQATLTAGNGETAAEAMTLIARGRESSFDFDLAVKNSTLKAGSLHVQGALGGGLQRVGIDGSTLTAPRGIQIGLNTVPSTITVQNSSQLNALAGSIRFDTLGRAIVVDNSTLNASSNGGEVAMDTQANGGSVTLRQATLNADVIKAQGHSASGDAVVVDGGSFVARTVLKFYASGASLLRFRGQVTINSPLSVFAAQTVQVDAGGAVTSNGGIDVYVNPGQDHFNKAGFGTMQGGTPASPGSLAPQLLPFDSPTKPSF